VTPARRPGGGSFWLAALLAAALSMTPVVSPSAPALAADEPPQQLIVRYVGGLTGVPVPPALASAAAGFSVALDYVRSTATGADVLRLSGPRLSESLLELLATVLARNPNIAYAEVDRIMHPAFVPNDASYGEQWSYSDPTGGLNLPSAWNTSIGANVVVGLVDTGYRPHADLQGNIVGGYDFIASTQAAGDGNGRDGDAKDPGDTCSGSPSSWHGTHIAGSIAAVTNNGAGVAGVAFGAKVLPLRALGRCGGTSSDIADAIVWGSGGTVPGLPANPNVAKVINLSLGAKSSTCSNTYQSAISSARSRGAVVVVAAGNAQSAASGHTPANCPGVVTVAATTRNGGRASYSNTGGPVDLGAPGGEGGPGTGILSTYNTGSSGPGSDSYAYVNGTSMATGHVSGVAALILSKNPSFSADQVESTLKSTARAFPTSCSGCGVGLVDAAAAVGATGSPPPPPPPPPPPVTTTTVPPVTTTTTTVPSGAPSAPRDLRAATRSWFSRGVQLNWATPLTGTVTGYNVYRRTGSGALVKIADLGRVTSWADTGTVSGTTYTYAVSAENGTQVGPMSNQSSARAR